MALILVADDQPSNRQLLTTLLGYCGHRTIEASDGAGALGMCRSERPDLVIADILMPTMDGYEFVRLLRQDPALAQTPVVFWSAIYHEREARALAESCGVRHLITKPAEPEAILEVVAAALRQPVAPVALPVEDFARDHSRLLGNKLASTVEELTAANLRLAALLDIGRQLAAERDPDRLVLSFRPAARSLVGCRHAGILLLSEGRLSVAAGGTDEESGAGAWVAALPAVRQALAGQRAVRVADVRPQAAAAGPNLTNGSLLVAPMRVSNGALGVAFFLDRIGRCEFDESDERLAVTLAAQAGVALENAVNYARVQRHARDLEREIEERKETEAALRASEQKFAKIFYANPRPMLIAAAAGGTVLEVNDSLVQATGFAREELAGKTELALPLWDTAAMQPLARILDSGGLPRDFDCTFRTRASALRAGLISVERIDLNGMPCRLWILKDITARKQAEERIRQQNAVLAGINRIFREAFTCDTEEQLARACLAVVEEVTESRFGFLAEIGAGGRLHDIAISDPGWAACRVRDAGARVRAGFGIRGLCGRVIRDGKGFYTNDPASHPDSIGLPEGHPPLSAFLGVPLVSNGVTIGMIAVANRADGYRPSDLEALEALAAGVVQVLMRKRAERALRAGEEQLRQAQKMESIGLLAGGIAHDFNNLLTAIMGNASLVREDVPEPYRQPIEGVIAATERAADLTRQLLAYAGKGRFMIERLDASSIVRRMTDLLGASLPKKVNLELSLPAGLPAIEGDPGQLQQIVMNLVLNAAEAIGTDAGTVTVSTRVQEVRDSEIVDDVTGAFLAPGSYVCLVVEDTGCGMDAETRAKIFDPFFTTKFVGRGLGLAAVAGIVQSYDGAIQLETAPGEGARFSVFLPAVDAPAARAPEPPQRAAHGAGTVLLVDDEAAVRDFARGALERYGYEVLVARNGRHAIRLLNQNAQRIGVVLLDLLMPVMGGDEAIAAMKQKRPDVPVIVFSGYSEVEALKFFAGHGVAGFLQKPFTAARLAEAVSRVLSAPAGSG